MERTIPRTEIFFYAPNSDWSALGRHRDCTSNERVTAVFRPASLFLSGEHETLDEIEGRQRSPAGPVEATMHGARFRSAASPTCGFRRLNQASIIGHF